MESALLREHMQMERDVAGSEGRHTVVLPLGILDQVMRQIPRQLDKPSPKESWRHKKSHQQKQKKEQKP